MKKPSLLRAALATAIALGAALSVSAPIASASTASATITAGSLAFVSSPSTVSFAATLNGKDQSITADQVFDVSDATGSGSGWNITATSTSFATSTTPVRYMTASAIVQSAPSAVCDSGSTCIVAKPTVTYPYTLPTGIVPPIATELFNAGTGTGMGDQSVTATFALAIPADAYAGTYSSTWTYSLVSGP